MVQKPQSNKYLIGLRKAHKISTMGRDEVEDYSECFCPFKNILKMSWA
jgi:hypothetical protein